MTENIEFDRALTPQGDTTYPLKADAKKDLSYSFERFVGCIKHVASKISDYAVNKLNDWFYFHKVLGQYGKEFYAMKLRTMTKDANGALETRLEKNGFDRFGKPNDDSYILKGKAWMRKYFVDETPQIPCNIIIQENMRWVGPRPKPKAVWAKFPKEHVDRELSIKPGLFGDHYRYPDLDTQEAEKKCMDLRESRPGSADLNIFIWICYNIIARGLRSK